MKCSICTTETIKHGEKLSIYCCRGSIPGPHLWQPYALPIVLTCQSASYFSFAYICQLLCSHTFVSLLDNFILFIINVRALSVFKIALTCFSVSFQLICHLRCHTIAEHVCSSKLTVFYCFNGLCFFKWDSAFNCEMINNETDWNVQYVQQRQLLMEKNFLFIAVEDRSQDLIFDSPMHYQLFQLVILPANFHLLKFVYIFVLIFFSFVDNFIFFF